MIWDWLAYVTALIGTGASAAYDIKTTYIPDEITHGMIILGLVLLFLRFDFYHALIYLGISGLVFLTGFFVYTLGQIGGGDVKLYTALALLVPTYSPLLFKTPTPPYPPIISIFFTSALFGAFFISIAYLVKLVRDNAKIKDFNKKIISGLLIASLVWCFSIYFLSVEPGLSIVFFMLSVSLLVYPFKQDLLDLYALRKKKIQELTEDDIIATDKLSEDLKKKLGIGVRRTYLEMELAKIKEKAKRLGIINIPVYDNLPTFGIYIFIGLLFTLLFGDFLFFLFSIF